MIPVIDLFAGPGGLNEGFNSVRAADGARAFQTVASFEMDHWASETLRLRAAMRLLQSDGVLHSDYYRFLNGDIERWEDFAALPHVAAALKAAEAEVHEHRLGENRDKTDSLIRTALAPHVDKPWVLIGGPPCQAYSLAGRSRRTNDSTFQDDEKHFLFREYLHIIERFEPTVFVMENVKGLLSSTNRGTKMFDLIRSDLSSPRPGLEYEIRSFVVDREPAELSPRDFVIQSEQYGVPQKRHRVILLGLRRGFEFGSFSPLESRSPVTVRNAIEDLPRVRSQISPRGADTQASWEALRAYALGEAGVTRPRKAPLAHESSRLGVPRAERDRTTYDEWVRDPHLRAVTLHESRSHMKDDLIRYGVLAGLAERTGRSLKLTDAAFQAFLPAHRNVGTPNTPFTDRFRVQLWDEPSSTVVSHISKDGHYYIHPDPSQMRSLTVREAARLQTFPDNYFFRGGRTQQYHQVGNAVPPLLARQLSEVVVGLLGI